MLIANYITLILIIIFDFEEDSGVFSPRMKSNSSRGAKGVSIDNTSKNIYIPNLDMTKKNLSNRGESLFSGKFIF